MFYGGWADRKTFFVIDFYTLLEAHAQLPPPETNSGTYHCNVSILQNNDMNTNVGHYLSNGMNWKLDSLCKTVKNTP